MKRSLMLVALLFAACSDDITRVGENTGGSSGFSGSSGSGGSGGSVTDLSGVWTISGSVTATGTFVTGTLIIDSTELVLTIDGATLSIFDHGSAQGLHWTNPKRQQDTALSLSRAPAAMALGVIPFGLGGQWTASHPTEPGGCQAALAPASLIASCQGVAGEPSGVPSLNGTLSATRTAGIPSAFGELGGSWHIQSNGGEGGSCSVTLSGNQLMASCAGTDSALDGNLSFVLDGNVGSGSSSMGLEFSAVRQ